MMKNTGRSFTKWPLIFGLLLVCMLHLADGIPQCCFGKLLPGESPPTLGNQSVCKRLCEAQEEHHHNSWADDYKHHHDNDADLDHLIEELNDCERKLERSHSKRSSKRGRIDNITWLEGKLEKCRSSLSRSEGNKSTSDSDDEAITNLTNKLNDLKSNLEKTEEELKKLIDEKKANGHTTAKPYADSTTTKRAPYVNH